MLWLILVSNLNHSSKEINGHNKCTVSTVDLKKKKKKEFANLGGSFVPLLITNECDVKFTVVANLVDVDSLELVGEDKRLVVVEHMNLGTCHSFELVALVGSSDSCMHLEGKKKFGKLI